MESYFFWLPPLNKKNDVQAQLFVHSIMKEVQIGNEIRGERNAKDQDLKLYYNKLHIVNARVFILNLHLHIMLNAKL